MQNSNNINFIQSGVPLLLLLLLFLLPCANVEAQTPAYKQFYYSTAPVSNVVVRNQPVTGEHLIAYRNNGTGFPGVWILYYQTLYDVAMQFNIPDTICNNVTIRYHINDMIVNYRRGYFCGTRLEITPTRNEETGETIETIESVGVLGYFNLNSSGFGNSGNVHIKLMQETKSLKRIAYSTGDDYEMIAMIGVTNLTSSPSCVVVASNQVYPESWYYNVRYTPDATETFTDIAINAKEVVVAAQRAGEVNRKYFFLRMARKDDIVISNDYVNLDYIHQFSPCDLFSPPMNILRHPVGTDIRLCAVPDDSYVHVAYTCESTDINHPCATALCGVLTAGLIVMDNVQIVKEPYDTRLSFVDMRYVAGGGQKTVALLYNDMPGAVGTTVLYPFAYNSAYGTPSVAFKQVLQDNQMTSINIHNGNSVRLAGVWDLISYNLTFLQQPKQQVGDKSKCMVNDMTYVDLVNSSQMATDSPDNPLTVYANMNLEQLNWGEEKVYPIMILGKQKVCEVY